MTLPEQTATESLDAQRAEYFEVGRTLGMAGQVHLVEVAIAHTIECVLRATPHSHRIILCLDRPYAALWVEIVQRFESLVELDRRIVAPKRRLIAYASGDSSADSLSIQQSTPQQQCCTPVCEPLRSTFLRTSCPTTFWRGRHPRSAATWHRLLLQDRL